MRDVPISRPPSSGTPSTGRRDGWAAIFLPSARVARACLAALVSLALVAATPALAQQPESEAQDWIPKALTFPADAEIVTDRAVGSTVRMFSVTTSAEAGPLLEGWAEALRAEGYAIEQGAEELLEDAIEFSGPGIANAKIVASRTAEEGETLIEFDATLD